MKPKLSFRAAISDLQLLGTALGGPSWKTWGALFIGAFGGELKPAKERFSRRSPAGSANQAGRSKNYGPSSADGVENRAAQQPQLRTLPDSAIIAIP